MKGFPVKDAAKIEFKDWTWGIDIDALVNSAVTEVITQTLADNPPEFVIWAREPVTDPLTITVELPFGADLYDPPSWEVSFPKLIDDWMFAYGNGDADARNWLASELRAIADRVEKPNA